jgi:hypothetical protein
MNEISDKKYDSEYSGRNRCASLIEDLFALSFHRRLETIGILLSANKCSASDFTLPFVSQID